MMSVSNDQTLRYIPGFDGLRALAVLAVIVYHLNLPYTSGGFLGVTVFFVLSGYLITSLLVTEWQNTQTINLRLFWIRRAKRLLPAMFLLLIVLNIIVPLLRPQLATALVKDTIAAFFYYSNWYYIFRDLSYFETFEVTSLLTHFWSLAIEEQFYIIWAVVIFFLFKMIKSRKFIFLLIIISALLSAGWMAMLYSPTLDPSRVYYGTDTRVFSLLLGAGVAILFPYQQLQKEVSKKRRWTFELLGMFGILCILLMVVFVNQYDRFIYSGGMLLLSLITGLLVLSLAMPSTVIANKILEVNVLKWIGVRSYSIYLWHFPILMLLNTNMDTSGFTYIKALSGVALTFFLAALSYSLVEKPIRQGTFTFNVKKSIVMTTCVCLCIGIANTVAYFSGPKHIEAFQYEMSAHPIEDNSKLELADNHKTTNTDSSPNQELNETGDSLKQELQQPEAQNKPTQEETKALMTKKITAIGDSVFVSPSLLLKETFPTIHIDAKVSRQMRDALAIVDHYKALNKLGEIVIIELGTNGPFPEETLKEVLDSIGSERTVLLINVRVPRPWESHVNKTLAEVSKKYTNAVLVDWYAVSTNQNHYFAKDGVHLKPEGAKAFAVMIEQAIHSVVSRKSI